MESVALQVAIAAEVEPEKSSDFGWLKQKRVLPQAEVDVLDGCKMWSESAQGRGSEATDESMT